MEVETMAMVCTEINEWVEEEVSKPVEEWEERQEKKCKKRKWYDPRGWFCWLVTILVKVVRWVVVTVGKWVVRTVCKLVATVVDIVKDVLSGLWDVIAGVFTLDWRRILDGLIRIGVGAFLGFFRLLRIILLGDTIDYIIGEVNKGRLRDYVRGLLEAKYSGETLDQIKEAIRLDHGAFGLRLNATAYRTILDSETPSPRDPMVPNLVVLHETGTINLRELCGFDFTEGFWNRKRYKTLKKGVVVAGAGGGEFDNPISEDELNSYLSSRGSTGPAFIVISMRDGVLDTKLGAAEEKGRELGLIINWEKELVEVIQPGHINHDGFDTNRASTSLSSFLVDIIGRTRKSVNESAATGELCNPVAVGIFRYTDTLRGLANNLVTSGCNLRGKDTSGVTFIDNKPDHFWKYVPIHEFGHYFGLCHVDGVDRIMVSTREKSWWSGWVIPNWLYLKGEPYFTFGEAKATWDYIVGNFTAQCLGARPVTIL
jgi:hypothetical protein